MPAHVLDAVCLQEMMRSVEHWHTLWNMCQSVNSIQCCQLHEEYLRCHPYPHPRKFGLLFSSSRLGSAPRNGGWGHSYQPDARVWSPGTFSASSALHSQHYVLTYILRVGCCCGNTAFTWISALTFCGEPHHWLSSDYLLSKELKEYQGMKG